MKDEQKKKYHTVGTVPKSNRKIVEAHTHTHTRTHARARDVVFHLSGFLSHSVNFLGANA